MVVENLRITIFPTFLAPILHVGHDYEYIRDPDSGGYLLKEPEAKIFLRSISNEFSRNWIKFNERIVRERGIERWRKVETSSHCIDLEDEMLMEFLREQQPRINESILCISSWEDLSGGSEVLGYEKLNQFFGIFHGRICALDIVAQKWIDLNFIFRHNAVLGCPQIQLAFSDESNEWGSNIPSTKELTLERENIQDIVDWLWHPTLGVEEDGPKPKFGINRKLVFKLHCAPFLELIEAIKEKFLFPEAPNCEHGFEVIFYRDIGDQLFNLTNPSGTQRLELLIDENGNRWPENRRYILRLKFIGQQGELEWKSIDKKVHKMEIITSETQQLDNQDHLELECKIEEMPLEPQRLAALLEACPEANVDLGLEGTLKEDEGLLAFFRAISPLFREATLQFDQVRNVDDAWFEQILAIFARANRIQTRQLHANHPAMDCQEFQKSDSLHFQEDGQKIAEWLCKPMGARKAQLSIEERQILFQFIEALMQQFLQAEQPLGFECQLSIFPEELEDEALEWGGFYAKPDEGTFRVENPRIGEALVFNEHIKTSINEHSNFVLKCVRSKSALDATGHEEECESNEFAIKSKKNEKRRWMRIGWTIYSEFRDTMFTHFR